MRSPVAELLADLSAALESSGLDWYLFGAQAALLYGAARLTADVDVTIRLPGAMSNEGFATVLERHQFERRFPDPDFTARTRVMPFVHRSTHLPLDVVFAGPGLEDQFLERVQIRDVEGTPVRVASAEDLVVMKILAGRPKDLDDVRAIQAAQGDRLHRAYIERTLAILEGALGQSDLQALLRQALGED
jgi:hypothetical protein